MKSMMCLGKRYRRLLRQKDILSQSQMGQNNTGSGTNRNRASTYTLKMYNYETENKLYRANIRGPSFKKIEDEKYKIVKSMYKRKNPKCFRARAGKYRCGV